MAVVQVDLLEAEVATLKRELDMARSQHSSVIERQKREAEMRVEEVKRESQAENAALKRSLEQVTADLDKEVSPMRSAVPASFTDPVVYPLPAVGVECLGDNHRRLHMLHCKRSKKPA